MAKQITKSYLEYLGVTDVTPDGRVFTKNGERKPQLRSLPGKYSNNKGYLEIKFYDSEKYKSVPKEQRTDNSGHVRVLVHQVVYAWFNSEVPYGKEIHHIDGNRFNNTLDNLEALTHEEHRAKHAKHPSTSTRELKCRLDIPREWYQKQLDELEALENKTKVNYDKISNYRAKLRYYDSHIAEANQKQKDMKDLAILKYLRDTYRKENNKTKWHMYCSLIKNWNDYDSNVKEQIMRCALGKIGNFDE